MAAAVAAGFPGKLARTYLSYHADLRVYKVLAVGLGAPRRRALCIPQGCPWSSMLLAMFDETPHDSATGSWHHPSPLGG